MENTITSENFSNNNYTKKDLFSRKVLFYVSFSIIFLLLIFTFLVSAPFNFPKESILNIEEGMNLREVSYFLKEKKVIRSRVLFEMFAIIVGAEKHIIPGDYFLEKKIPVYEVASRIGKGKKNLAPVKVTIPEGFNNQEIKDTFVSKLPKFDGEKFLEISKDKEGYLFPDTYFFFTTDTEENVLEYMTKNFEKKVKPINPKIEKFGKSLEQVIIMASIVEKEAKGDLDREYISGILWKRLSIGMPLQVDAAMITYKEKGLPAKPISNPGFEAILATLEPKTSPYLYYLHDDEGNIHYAKNFEEHKVNKLKYLK